MCPWLAVCVFAVEGMLTPGVHYEAFDGQLVSQPVNERVKNCLLVVDYAEQQEEVPTHLAIAVAYTESRFNDKAVSRSGAVGVMQVIPKFHCKENKKHCDLIAKGVGLLARLKKKYKTWSDALCHYASGNVCRPAGERYSRKVLRLAQRVERSASEWNRIHCE